MNKIYAAFAGITLLVGGINAPIIPTQPEQLVYSYTAAVYDTPSGQLQQGYFYKEVDGKTYTVVHSATSSQDYTVPVTDTTGLTEAHVSGSRYGSVFKTSSGLIDDVPITSSQYAAMALPEGEKYNPSKMESDSLLQILVPTAEAAIARDAANTMTKGSAGVTSVTFNHTVTGSNTLLFAGGMWIGTSPTATYNGTNMTQQATITPSGGQPLYLYYTVGAPTGSHNVVLGRTGSTDTMYYDSVSYNGVSQSGFPDASNTGSSASATALPVAVTTVAANAVAFMIGEAAAANCTTPVDCAGTGSTAPTSPGAGAGNLNMLESSTFPIASPGSYTMNFAVSANQALAAIMVSFAPAATANTWVLHTFTPGF